MRTDGLFTLHEFVVRNWQFGRTLRLIPFGDIHRDSPAHSDNKWKEFLDHTRKLRDTVYLGMGDYLDSYSTSERALVYNEKIHESTRKRDEEMSKGRVNLLAKELAHLNGKTVGLLGGNHFVQFANGTTGDMLLASHLGTSYLGVCSAIRILFDGMKGQTQTTIDIFAHHGRGAGVTAAGKFNAVEKLSQVCDADIFLMGDNHARGAFPLGDKLRIAKNPNGLYLRSRQAFIGRTGSFLRGYVPNMQNYVVDGAMTPANLGWIEFEFTPKRTCADGGDRVYVEIKAVQ